MLPAVSVTLVIDGFEGFYHREATSTALPAVTFCDPPVSDDEEVPEKSPLVALLTRAIAIYLVTLQPRVSVNVRVVKSTATIRCGEL